MKLAILISLASVAAEPRRKLVMYWGCDNPYNAGSKSFMDLPLDKFCDRGTYDYVQLAFLDMFFDQRNHNYPHMHLHKHHCNTTFPGMDPDPNVGLIHCPAVGKHIQYCQSKGIKVGLSMGGGTGSYYFTDDKNGQEVANTLWDMFFVARNGSKIPRPFDDAVLDGVGLDIEGGSGAGFGGFLSEFHKLSHSAEAFNGVAQKPIYIGAAPQCTAGNPGHIGFMWPILSKYGNFLTDVWVQFYNNYCYYGGGKFNGAVWQKALHQINPNIKWYAGIPASSSAGGGYIGGSVGSLAQECAAYPNWDGVMMWDASWDQYSGWYSETVRRALDSCPPAPPPSPPVPPPPPPTCHAISGLVTDEWCQTNCFATPPNCPPTLCKCSGTTFEFSMI